jgi:hypothetical protein
MQVEWGPGRMGSGFQVGNLKNKLGGRVKYLRFSYTEREPEVIFWTIPQDLLALEGSRHELAECKTPLF